VKTTPRRVAVILARPENPENIGLVARAMKNTGFSDLRLAGVRRLGPMAYRTAVHATDILDGASQFPDAASAVADRDVVLAGTAKPRKNVSLIALAEAVPLIRSYPSATRFGLLFGNERTGLTADELLHANFVFTIPQASRQPSYNLSSAVLLALFALFMEPKRPAAFPGRERPLPRREQETAIRLILEKLAAKGFIHGTNRRHVTEMMHDLLGRLAMTEKDRRLLLAIFTKGVDNRAS
jgi:TrmH family RNA methyltransferase